MHGWRAAGERETVRLLSRIHLPHRKPAAAAPEAAPVQQGYEMSPDAMECVVSYKGRQVGTILVDTFEKRDHR